MPIATRLTNTGSLLVNGSFNEQSLATGSLYFNQATTSRITFSGNANYALGTGDFTCECFIWIDGIGVGNRIIIETGTDATAAGYMTINSTTLGWGPANGTVLTFAFGTQNLSTWYHVAITRSSGTLRAFINGTQSATAGQSDTNNYTQNALYVGSTEGNAAARRWPGYLSNLRLIKGTALYTSNFAVPPAPLTAVTNTVFLMTMPFNSVTNSGVPPAYLDTSSIGASPSAYDTTNAASIADVPNSTGLIPVLSSRLTSTQYSAETLDELTLDAGSISFSGAQNLSGNYTAFQQFTDPFTVEAWIYPTVVGGVQNSLWSTRTPDVQDAGWDMFIDTNGKLVWGTRNVRYITGTTTLTVNTWSYVTLVRSSTTSATLYLNGVSQGTATVSGTQNFTNGTLTVGGGYTGRLTNFRLVKGVAVYSGAFTPPQSILSAVTGTSLLLNVTDSTNFITDGSSNNFTLTNTGTATWNTSSPFNASPAVSRQISDGTLQVTTAFDEFTGAPVVDTSLQLWLDSGQTASYPGSGTTWTDLSGQSNTGTLNNSPTFSPTVGGGTFLFNGTTQTATTVSLNLQQNFTLEAWVNQNVLNGFAIFGQGTQATNNGLHIWYTANTTIRFGMYGNDTDFTVSTSTGIWYHMIFTYNHSSPYTKGFYLNAVVRAGSNVSGPAAYTGSGTFRLGATYSTAGNFGNGYFEGVKMYNRILTADEITTNFNALRGRFGI